MFDYDFNENKMEKYILFEFDHIRRGRVSIVNDNQYAIVIANACLKDAIRCIININKEYTNLIMDIIPHDVKFVTDTFKENNLKLDINYITREQSREMNNNQLTLLGYYKLGYQLQENLDLLQLK